MREQPDFTSDHTAVNPTPPDGRVAEFPATPGCHARMSTAEQSTQKLESVFGLVVEEHLERAPRAPALGPVAAEGPVKSVNSLLRILDNEIAARAADSMNTHPDWPCRRGCDHCCRHLATEPSLTAAEWERIETVLPLAEIQHRLRNLNGPPYACPFLDRATGTCAIYEVRPIACRTYGFYVERDQGLYCSQIEARQFTDVIWGNQTAIDHRLDTLGPRIPLRVRYRVE